VSLLLDTHALLWRATGDDRLGPAARVEIDDPLVPVFVSAATIWEIEIKISTGKLTLGLDLLDVIEDARFEVLSINGEHAALAGRLPLLHRDPFDRMLIAQAQIEHLRIVTTDAAIERYRVAVVNASL
jgi:PIN domain nuclease of toxin-antitoxin system